MLQMPTQLRYRYSSLDVSKHEIRLLAVLPGHEDDDIQCTLQTVSLDCDDRNTNIWHTFSRKKPTVKWEALSYCWGDASDLLPISVCGKRLMITRNLWTALRRFRLRDRARTLWADAICIDQSSPEERGVQIQYMTKIYQRAETVLIWLGEANKGEALAFILTCDIFQEQYYLYHFEILSLCIFIVLACFVSLKASIVCSSVFFGLFDRKIRARLRQRRVEIMCRSPNDDAKFKVRYQAMLNYFRRNRGMQEEILAGIESLGYEEFFQIIWTTFGHLLDRPWFKRTWVIQEAANANSLTVSCGKCTVPWSQFYEAAKWINDRHENEQLNFGPDDFSPQGEISLIETLRQQQQEDGRKFTLLQFLVLCRNFDVTDPRDKIYALLGLAPKSVTLEATESGLLTPRYDQGVREVYMRMARWQITNTRKLDILNCGIAEFDLANPCNLPSNPHKLPSWTPDWCAPKPIWAFRHKLHYSHSSGNGYRASLDKEAQIYPGAVTEHLGLAGTILDEVQNIVDDFHDISTVLSPNHGVWQYWNSFVMSSRGATVSHNTIQARLDSYWRILLAVETEYINLPATIYWPFFCSYFSLEHLLPKSYESNTITQEVQDLKSNGLPKRLLYRESKSMVEKILHQVSLTVRGRKLFITKEGLLGLASANARVGDKVCILWGGDLPFLIRPVKRRAARHRGQGAGQPFADSSAARPKTYTFICESFVDGLQDGEGIAMAQERGIAEQIIYLQ